jgi:hypothetical protein
LQSKYDKKITNASKSSFVIAIICDVSSRKNPLVEEICSVAMSVQNMLLVAAAHKIGAYWSSSSVHGVMADANGMLTNPDALCDFLELDKMKRNKICLGWISIGDYYGEGNEAKKKWPEGRRKEIEEQRITWK